MRLSSGIDSAKKVRTTEVSSTDFSSNCPPPSISKVIGSASSNTPIAHGTVKNSTLWMVVWTWWV